MATGADLARLAMELSGTQERPHFDRRAFRVARTYATLAADEKTANVKFTPDEQAFKTMMYPEAIEPIDNGWGRQGWTLLILDALDEAELRACLEMAHAHALEKSRKS